MYRYAWLQIDETAKVGKIRCKRGRASLIGFGCYIMGKIEIGEGVLISPNVTITSSSHGIAGGKPVKDQPTVHKPVIIGDHVFIGAGAVILGGNKIGNHAVIGAGSVLTEDHVVGDNEIWVGNPAKFLKVRT